MSSGIESRVVRDIMSAPVVTVAPAATVHEIAALLVERRLGGLPVLDGTRLVGIVTSADLVRRREIGTQAAGLRRAWWHRLVGRDPLPALYVKAHGRCARDIMSRRPVCVPDTASLGQVASLFGAHRVGRLPVVRGRQLIGIVTRRDLVRAVARSERAPDLLALRSDEAIRSALLKELERQPWWRPRWSNVDVADGVVRFCGVVESEAAREAARVAAENVAGVRGVRDDRLRNADWLAMV